MMDQPKDIASAAAVADPAKSPVAPPAAVVPPTIDTPAIKVSADSADRPSGASADAGMAAPGGAILSFIKVPRIAQFAPLAAAIALAAGIGSFAGAFGAASFLHAPAPDAIAVRAETKDAAAKISAELAALKTGIETTARNANAQLAKLAERVDKAQADPASKLARIGETLERLEKRPPATVAVSAAPAPETTGSIPEKTPPKPALVEGWILRDIYDGIALIESRRGMIEVTPGSNIPGVGRVETIRKQDGRWIVVTAKGNIVGPR